MSSASSQRGYACDMTASPPCSSLGCRDSIRTFIGTRTHHNQSHENKQPTFFFPDVRDLAAASVQRRPRRKASDKGCFPTNCIVTDRDDAPARTPGAVLEDPEPQIRAPGVRNEGPAPLRGGGVPPGRGIFHGGGRGHARGVAGIRRVQVAARVSPPKTVTRHSFQNLCCARHVFTPTSHQRLQISRGINAAAWRHRSLPPSLSSLPFPHGTCSGPRSE